LRPTWPFLLENLACSLSATLLQFVLFLVRLGNGLGSSQYCRQSNSKTNRTFHDGMAALRHFLDIVVVAPAGALST
jgi:hypothetical protein